MKGHRIPAVHSSHPNVTPLIDIVMCLIIFYMLVAKIGVNTGQSLTFQLPVSLQGIKITDMGNTATINIAKPDVGDEPFVTALDPRSGQMVTLKLLEGTKRPLTAFLKLGRGNNAKFKAILRADENLDYRFLEPVLLVCREADVAVTYATRNAQYVTPKS